MATPDVSAPPMVEIPKEEWKGIVKQLEPFHSVFYTLGKLGRPFLTESCPTACVVFDKAGQCIDFQFNPTLWKESSNYKRLFIICHECLHVLLDHGVRMSKDPNFADRINKALDIVVNHMLVNAFGFLRSQVEGWEKYCWLDTVYVNPDGSPRTKLKNGESILPDQCFEYYFNTLSRTRTYPGATVDEHAKMGGMSFENINKELVKRLPPSELEKLQEVLEDQYGPKFAGTGAGGLWHQAKKLAKKRIKKWESVIQEWAYGTLKKESKHQEQWARTHRRHVFLPQDMMLPSDMGIDANTKGRIEVFFFLDTSGSCWHLKDRFFAAAESLPKESFDVRLFCFDDEVMETSLEGRRMRGSGGTSFHIIEQHIQRLMREEDRPYPRAVFIITDGYGNRVGPARPKVWHWFLSGYMEKEYFHRRYAPPACNVYKLSDFE